MKRFWCYHSWEGLLCLLAAATLLLNFAQGFYIPDGVANSVPLALALCGAVLLYAYFGSYNRVTMVCFSLGAVALAAGAFLWMRGQGIDVVDAADSDTAVYIYYIAAPIIALLTFLLTRSRLGTAVWFLAGSVFHGLIAYLGYDCKVWCAVGFAAAMVALFLLRQARVTALRSQTKTPNFRAYFGTAVGVAVGSVLLALGIWAAIIRPLAPPTVDVVLLTRYMRYDVLEMVGIAQQYPLPQEEQTAEPPEQTMAAQQPDQTDEAPPLEQTPQEQTAETETETALSQPDRTETVASVSYGQDVTPWLVLFLVLLVLLLSSIVPLRRLARKRRLQKLTRGTAQEQIVAMYRFYLRLFGRLGYGRGTHQTEWEYVAAIGDRLAPFLSGGPDLETLTAWYMDARYGGFAADAEICQAMASLYPIFLKNCRTLLGRGRYLTHYFVL
jgi:hypothetical protein